LYHLVLIAGLYGQNKAKTVVSVAVEAKLEVEIWRRPQKINSLTLVSYSLLQTVFNWDVPFRHNTKRHRQQTDRWHIVPKARPIVRSAKNMCILLQTVSGLYLLC